MAKNTKPFPQLRPAFEKHLVPDDMIDKLCGELRPGEKILWIGRPVPEDMPRHWKGLQNYTGLIKKASIGLLAGGAVLALVALLTCGLVFNWLLGAVGALAVFFSLAGFGGIGLLVSFAIGRAKHKIENERDTRPCYLVTSQRVLIHCGTWFQDGGVFQQYGQGDLKKMSRVDSHMTEGVGDLIFKQTSTTGPGTRMVNRTTGVTASRRAGMRMEYTYGMLSIPKVKAVERLIRERLLGETGG